MTFTRDSFTIHGSETLGIDLKDHTSAEDGSTWVTGYSFPGPIVINPSGEAYLAGGAAGVYLNQAVPPSASYSVQADFKVVSILDQEWGVLCNGQNSTINWYWWQYSPVRGGLTFQYNGVLSDVTVIPFTVQVGQTYTLKMTITTGGVITGYLNGVQQLSFTDTSNTDKGHPGIIITTGNAGSDASPTTGVHVLNFSATDLAGATLFTLSPTTATTGTNETITVTGTNTNWTGSTTFSVSGGTGASISGLTVSSATSASFTLHPGTAAGNLTISDSTDSDTATITISAASAVTVGALTLVSETTNGIQTSWSAATGGTGSGYSYSLYRSSTAPFTPPGGGTLVATTTNLSATDTNPGSGTVFYRVLATDSGGNTGLSKQNSAQGSLIAREESHPYVIGFIGDSITAGVGISSGPTAVQVCTSILSQGFGVCSPVSYNQGSSGTATSDWLPNSGLLNSAISAFQGAGVTHVLIMLGTNDPRPPYNTSVNTYLSNLQSICTTLVADGFKVILDGPPCLDPSTGFASGNGWNEGSLSSLIGYRDGLASIANGTTIFVGETQAFDYFTRNLNQLSDGIHPNDPGHSALGGLWAQGFVGSIIGSVTPSLATGYSVVIPNNPVMGSPTQAVVILTGGSSLSSPLVVTLNDANGVFNSPITVSNGSTFGLTTYTPTSSGNHTVSATHSGGNNGMTNPSNLSFSVSAGGSGTTLSYSINCPSDGYVNIPVIITVTLVGNFGSTTVSLKESNSGGIFFPSSITLDPNNRIGFVEYVSGVAGQKSISATNSAGLTDPSPSSIYLAKF